ncbi:uncharacterized protein LOC129743207 [Uranotaenia lowii]|uniref:uncharacterized protein LOC129743207 n=1 Tax=Uranotaenia lowii TaxID=190385 RepID=UPI0024786377|nr:uncharacterized protein LOC129743207 [Uranotaenia lowii]
MSLLVSDTTTYQQVNCDPTSKILKQLNAIVEKWHQDQHIDYFTKTKLQTFHCHPPRIYGLPKIHKPERPLRPVVSTIGSATNSVARYLTDILNNIVGKTEYHVKNSFVFAEDISKVRIPEGCVMFSLDVVSLYANVPAENAYDFIEDQWHRLRKYTTLSLASLQQALSVVLKSSFFKYNNNYYKQIHGVPMGSSISGCIASICMETLEQGCIERLKQKNISLIVYKRYVDDCFVVAKENDIDAIFEEFNNAHKTLKFTLEKEEQQTIRFLDMTLSRQHDKIIKTWFTKQPDGRYLDFNSESPFTHKQNTVFALVDRALKLSDPETRKTSIDAVKNILGRNNYPQDILHNAFEKRTHAMYNTLQNQNPPESTSSRMASIPYIPGLSERVARILRKHDVIAAFKPCDKIKSTVFTKLKDPIPKMMQTNVVYSVPCSCGKEYIGQTSQTLEKRTKQHENSIRVKNKQTGLAQHALEDDADHTFDFAKTQILERISHKSHRLIAEKLHIKLRGNQSVNLQIDTKGVSNAYNGLWTKLREERERENPKNSDKPTSRRQPAAAAAIDLTSFPI